MSAFFFYTKITKSQIIIVNIVYENNLNMHHLATQNKT